MKILHVAPSVGPLRGGPSLVLRTIARELAKCGVDVDVATTDDNGPGRLDVPLARPVVEAGVTYRYFPRQTRCYTTSTQLARWTWTQIENYDLAHIHAIFSWASTVGAWSASAHGVPYIIRPHGILNQWGLENRRPWLKRLSLAVSERSMLEGASAVQFTCEQERDEAKTLGFRTQTRVIGNPVEVPAQRPRRGLFRARHPELAHKTIYLFLSRIDRKKGLDLLISAFAHVRATFPNSALVIAGDGAPDLVGSLRLKTSALGFEDAVVWTGFLEGAEKWECLADADVFVLPSYSENFGMAVVEAMAFEIPLIVSDQVGLCSIIEKRRAGLITRCDAGEFGRAMVRLGTDPVLRSEFGAAGRLLAESEFSPAAVSAQLLILYRDVIRNQAA